MVQRLLRRVGFIRYLALYDHRRTRRKQADASSDYIQSVLTTIGNITIAWAGIELMLTHLVVWHHVQNRVRPKGGLPRMLSYQLQYIRKNIETDPALDPRTAAKLAELRQRVDELNKFRVSIIHGVLHQRNRRTTDWHTHSVKIEGLGWRVIKHSYLNDDIQAKSKEIGDLGHELSPFIARIIGMPHPFDDG